MFTSPTRVDFARPITLAWKPVPRAVGYSAQAAGLHRATGRSCLWEARKDGLTSWAAEGTTAGVRSGKLLGASQTRCTIPAGIFRKGEVHVIVLAYSADVQGSGSMPSRGWAQSTGTLTLEPAP